MFLLVALLLYLGCAPFLQDLIRLRILIDFFLCLIFFSILYTVSEKRHQFFIALAFTVVLFALIILRHFYRSPELGVISGVFEILLFSYTTVIILNYVLNQNRVTADLVYAAMIGYLFIGVIWANIYSLLSFFYPGSLTFDPGGSTETQMVFTYFSFITLTTLGYGDITPLTDRAFAFTVIEAIIGQFYLTVLVARLVGLHIAHKTEKECKKSNL